MHGSITQIATVLFCGMAILISGNAHALDTDMISRKAEMTSFRSWRYIDMAADVIGISDEQNKDIAGQTIRLYPGETLRLRMPKGESLQVIPENPEHADMLWITASEGMGLYRSDRTIWSNDKAAAITSPISHDPWVARIRLNPDAAEAVSFKPFISHTRRPDPVMPYRIAIKPDLEPVTLERTDTGTSFTAYFLPAHRPIQLKFKEKGRLAVTTRYIYPDKDPERMRHADITTWRDHHCEPVCRRIYTLPDEKIVGRSADGVLVVGRPDTRYEAVTGPDQSVGIESSHPVAVIFQFRPDPDTLIPALNPVPRPAEGPDRLAAIQGKLLRPRDRDDRLSGVMALHHWADMRPDAPEIEAAYIRAKTLYTRYRRLIPHILPPSARLTNADVSIPVLRPWDQQASPMVVSESHAGSLSRQVISARFAPVIPTGKPLTYHLPPRFSETQLQLIFRYPDAPVSADVMVGDRVIPIELQPAPDVPAEAFFPTPFQKAAAAIKTTGTDPVVMPPEMLPAMSVMVPPRIDTVRIRPVDAMAGFEIAARILTEKHLPASETDIIDMVAAQKTGGIADTLTYMLHHADHGDRFECRPNSWSPEVTRLAHLIQARTVSFQRDAVPWTENRLGIEQPRPQHPDDSVNPLTAVTAALQNAPPQQKDGIRLEVATTLLMMGESVLAEAALKSLFLFSRDDDVVRASGDALESIYTEQNTLGKKIQLAAARYSRKPTRGHLHDLAELLFHDGKTDLAFWAALGAMGDDAPSDILINTALTRGWAALVDRLCAMRPDTPNVMVWQGVVALHQGKNDMAEVYFSQGGPFGMTFRRAMKKGDQIRQSLSDPAARLNAINAWMDWEECHPGPWGLKDISDQVTSYAAAGDFYIPSRHLFSRSVIATPSHPVHLKVAGTGKVHIMCRALLSTADRSKASGWVKIFGPRESFDLPFTDLRPIDTLIWEGPEKWCPTEGFRTVITLSKGVTDLSFLPDTGPVALWFFQEQPLLRLPVLPRFSPFFTFDVRDENKTLTHSENTVWVVNNHSRTTVPIPPLPGGYTLHPDLPAGHITCVSGAARTTRSTPDVPATIHWEALTSLIRNPPDPADMPPENTLAHIRHLAERHPGHRAELAAMAMALCDQHPGLTPPLSDRHGPWQNLSWQPISDYINSAGSRRIPATTKSVSPFDTRRIIAGFPPDARILTGQRALAMATKTSSPTTVDVTLMMGDMPFFNPAPMLARLTWPGHSEDIPLTPDQPVARRRITLPGGTARMTVTPESRWAGQFLGVRIESPDRSPLEADTRLYQVATPEEPLETVIPGPAWIRIDRMTQEGPVSSEAYIPYTGKRMVLRPQADEKESLFRLYRITSPPVSAEPPPRRPHPTVRIVARKAPASVFSIPHDIPAALVTDPRLFRNTAGTWDLGAEFHARRNFDEPDEPSALERFAESRVTWRRHKGQWRLRASGLLRFREFGGPTSGVGLDSEYLLENINLTLGFGLRGFLQAPDQQTFSLFSGDMASSGTAKGSVTYRSSITSRLVHRPRIQLFGRYMSLSDMGSYDPQAVDRDVFTGYKKDHPQGMRLSESLMATPWLDTRWQVTAGLLTNASFDPFSPDRLTLDLSWQQYLGPVTGKAGYGYAYLMDDEDRNNSFSRNILRLGMDWSFFHKRTHRFNISLDMRYDLTDKVTEAALMCHWAWIRGRLMDDYLPGEIPFKRLTLRRLNMTHQTSQQGAENGLKDTP